MIQYGYANILFPKYGVSLAPAKNIPPPIYGKCFIISYKLLFLITRILILPIHL